MLKNVARLATTTQIRGAGLKHIKILNPSADIFPEKGIDAEKGPVKIKLEAGQEYSFCNCGHSIKQPFCDGSHKSLGKTYIRPIKFTVDKTDDYTLCQCKQTETRPLCDGSHKNVNFAPKNADATVLVAMGTYGSPVYEGVARKLGYRHKKGFQQ